MELDKDDIKMIENEITHKSKKTVSNNLIIIIGFIIVIFLFQIAKGKIDLSNLNGNKYLPKDYKTKPFFEDIVNKLNNVKEYLIFFGILLIIFFFIHKSNLNWEKKMLKKYKFLENTENNEYIHRKNNNFELNKIK